MEPDLLILASLAGGPQHGYAIMASVEATAGVRLGPGTLYKAIPRLERQGLIEGMTPVGRRRPYRLTARGAGVLRVELERMRALSSTALQQLEATQ